VKKFVAGYLFISLGLVGCANLDQSGVAENKSPKMLNVEKSFLVSAAPDMSGQISESENPADGLIDVDDSANVRAGMVSLLPAVRPVTNASTVSDLSVMFPEEGALEIIAEEMTTRDFIHYIFGEMLQVNYVLDPKLASAGSDATKPITLSIVTPLSKRETFSLVNNLLVSRDIQVRFVGDAFFIHLGGASGIAEDVELAFGREASDVPNTTGKILQIVPLKFGIKLSLQSSIVQLTNTMVTPSYEQDALFIRGSRSEVIRALDLLELLDIPAARGRHIGMIKLDFITPSEFSAEVDVLLNAEGLLTSVGGASQRNVVMVPLEKLGAVAVFSATKYLLDRVQYWASLVDVAGGGSDEQYFFFQPKYARAKDIGASLSQLLSKDSRSAFSDRSERSRGQENTGVAPSSTRRSGFSSDTMKVVVDERSNALIFFTTGSEYRGLFPLLSKLDTLPKQVSLEITIAEVSLQDEFKHGFEWAVTRGELSLTTEGAFGVSTIGGLGLIINGTEGPLSANFLSTNSLVNVLSRPTLTVRDGVTASINVGSDISVIGATTQDPINGQRQTTTSEYRKTGVDISVTPTINAQGIIVMEVDQTISNSVPSSSGASGNPDIFERGLSTEVVARSGQTVIMGGLISANYNVGGSAAPGLGSIPILGNLFKSNSDSRDRTELVMLITPKVLNNLDEWDVILNDFQEGLKYLSFDE